MQESLTMRYEIDGLEELENLIKALGELPQKCVNKAAKKGIMVAKADAKRGSWVDVTGYLRKAIKEKAEKTRIKGKKVYDLRPDSAYNDVFVKVSKSGKRSYYPASIEHGFTTKSGKHIPGFNYLRDSLTSNKTRIEKEIVDVLSDEIDKEMKK